jgi:sec-independent protein translocase protein TatA
MNIASLFNLAGPDLIIILLIVLLLFGAKKLPELAKGMGQAVREFTKAKDEFEREVTRPVETPAPPAAKLEEPRTDVAHETHHDSTEDPHHPHADQHQEPAPTRVI